MRGVRRTAWAAVLAASLIGCAYSGPLVDNPAILRTDPSAPMVENPVYVPLGPPAYGVVFEKVIDTVDDYFEIAYSNRYEGRIESFPKIAPGLERFFLPGSPDFEQRTLAWMQTIRHQCFVLIQPSDDPGGGFFIDVRVMKELEDLPRPTRQTAGGAAFRSDNTVERQFEVIDATSPGESNWIPIGRDFRLEHEILQRLRKCM
jgi:hypothetical protein